MSKAATTPVTLAPASAAAGSLRRNKRYAAIAEAILFLAAASSVLITIGIVAVLTYESASFFEHVSIREFLTGREWTPLFEPPKFGILPLLSGTLVTTAVALCVAIPAGTIIAVWLSEYAPYKFRETLKPALELLSAVPTVVFGYFALQLVTPLLQKIIPGLPGFNMLSAGLVMGVMIIPYVASLSEDAMRAVPIALREGAYAMGATRVQTAWKVVFPAALSGISAAYILAVARALGETMVVAIAAGQEPTLTIDPRDKAETISAFIVRASLGDQPHGSIGYQSIFAAGLSLALMTLVFNIAGFFLRRRFREAY
ncbi:MAG: phosphate ABC transporter permease subunit PstC [Phycisphaeraceae bacterium]|nr:phosphate ABC transporter permease subunit PstC [Phycisphaeraceae bacterium]